MSMSIYLECEHCDQTVYEANITHNLAKIALELGIYDCLWGDEAVYADELIQPLTEAIRLMTVKPDDYRIHDAPNGWGTMDQFLPWCTKLLEQCTKHPDMIITISS